jgi:uncharacterized membrane protein YdjX (TVP38/TMEM64 family)
MLDNVFNILGKLAEYWLLVVLVSTIGVVYYFLSDYISIEMLRDHQETLVTYRDSNYFLAAITFIAAYTIFVALSIPGGLILSITGGFLFSTFPGVFFNILGATSGATTVFLAARWGFGSMLAGSLQSSQGLVKKIKDGIDKNQWSMLFLIRLIPGVPFFLANLVPSFLDVPLRRFVISTFLGILPASLVFTSIGSGIGEILISGGTPDLGVLWEPEIIFPILGLCVLAALPILVNFFRDNDDL